MLIYHVYSESFKGLDKLLSLMHTNDHDGVISHINKIIYNDGLHTIVSYFEHYHISCGTYLATHHFCKKNKC